MIYLKTAYDTFNHCWDCAADPQWWLGVIKSGWEHPQTQRAWTQLKTPKALGTIAGVITASAVAYYVWHRYQNDQTQNAAGSTGGVGAKKRDPHPISDDGNYQQVEFKPPEDTQGAE